MQTRIPAAFWLAIGGTLVGCSSAAPPAAAPEPAAPAAQPATALPSPQQLIAQHIEAAGGEAAIRRYTSSRAVGQLSIPAQGITGDVEVFNQAPNKFLLRVEVPGFGTVAAGYDGEVGWSHNPALGPMVLEGRMLDQMREQSDYYGLLSRDEYAASMTTLERTEFEGRPCYAVQVTTKWGEQYVEYYDAETGLMAGGVRDQESPMGAMETTTILRNYRDFGGVFAPAEMVQRTMNIDQIVTITEVEYDAVDPAVFELPPEIQALVGG